MIFLKKFENKLMKSWKMEWLKVPKEPNYKTNTTLMVWLNGAIPMEIKRKK